MRGENGCTIAKKNLKNVPSGKPREKSMAEGLGKKNKMLHNGGGR